jgi:hypothetical protein
MTRFSTDYHTVTPCPPALHPEPRGENTKGDEAALRSIGRSMGHLGNSQFL